jgi:hypothetical protein
LHLRKSRKTINDNSPFLPTRRKHDHISNVLLAEMDDDYDKDDRIDIVAEEAALKQ